MPASNHTNNYELPIYVANDHFSVLGDLNDAMRTIDAELAVASQGATSASTDAANALAAANAASEAAGRAKDSADSTLTTAASAQATATAAREDVAVLRTRVDGTETLASTARDTAATANATANTASERASNALGTANSALSTASGIASTAEAAATDAAEALSLATSANGSVSALATHAGYLYHATGGSDITVSGSLDTNMVTASLSNLIVGHVYLAIVQAEIRVPSGVGGSKNIQVSLDNGILVTSHFNDDPYTTAINVIVPFKATATNHTVNAKLVGSADGSMSALRSTSHIWVI